MKNYIKLFGIIALVAVIVFSMAACKKSNSSASVASTSNKVDNLLTDYEKFVNDYAALMQRIKAGDTAALADAEKLQAQVDEWAAKWEGISEKDFTQAQTGKLLELTNKFTSSLGL